jgi:hypothetical protein
MNSKRERKGNYFFNFNQGNQDEDIIIGFYIVMVGCRMPDL